MTNALSITVSHYVLTNLRVVAIIKCYNHNTVRPLDAPMSVYSQSNMMYGSYVNVHSYQ